MSDGRFDRRLVGDVRVPAVGFGTYRIEDPLVSSRLDSAFATGYRHVDTAEAYRNEPGVGRSVSQAANAGRLVRGEIFITTKLWPASPDGTPRDEVSLNQAAEASLARLGCEYVDLLLLHAPGDQTRRLNRWVGMLEILRSGRARAIGVSNYGVAHVHEILDAGLPAPHADQIELHPWSQQRPLVSFLRQHDIVPLSYSSLAPLGTWRTAAGSRTSKNHIPADVRSVDNALLMEIALRHDASPAQVLLRWALQHGFPVLPKSNNPDRMRENANLFHFALDSQAMQALDALDRAQPLAWGEDPTTVQ